MNLNTIKQYGGMIGKGLILEMAPGIAKGIIVEWFHKRKVDVTKVTQDVQNNRSLLDTLEPNERQALQGLAQRVGSLDFITPELVITSIKKDFPAVASLFLSWPEAGEWLTRQVEDIKREAAGKTP